MIAYFKMDDKYVMTNCSALQLHCVALKVTDYQTTRDLLCPTYVPVVRV